MFDVYNVLGFVFLKKNAFFVREKCLLVDAGNVHARSIVQTRKGMSNCDIDLQLKSKLAKTLGWANQ